MAGQDVNDKGETNSSKKGVGNAGQYSEKLIMVKNNDLAAEELAKRINGEACVKFENDPDEREFDVVSDEYIGQAKPPLKKNKQECKRSNESNF